MDRTVRTRAAMLMISAAFVLVAPASAQAGCSTTRATSLPQLAAEVGAGHSACLAAGTYTGSVDLANPTDTPAVVTQEGGAVIHGQVRMSSSHLEINGLTIDNGSGSGKGADCLRIQSVGGTDIRVVDSNVGPCARDAIRMAYNVGAHDTAVTIQRNHLHDTVWNACTCYMRGGLFADNLVENISNDALDLWGDSNIVRHNVFRNLIANPTSNHNDVLQTWQIPGDPATGDPLTNLLFNRNIIDSVKGPDAHGLMIHGGSANDNLSIRSNLFRDIGSLGMLLDGTTDADVFANTFVRAGGLDTVEWKAGASGRLDSNIFYEAASAGGQPWYQDVASSPLHSYNLAWGGALISGELGGLNADPQFYDAGGTDANRDDDFWLSAATSPAVDHGNPWTTNRIDVLGRPVNNEHVDNGAFEYYGDGRP